jgi:ATP-dependent Zn protease
VTKFAVGLIAACLVLAFAPAANAGDDDYLTYAEFIAAVEAGTVKSVSVDRVSSITGTRNVGGQDRQFRTFAETGSANDVLMIRLLNEKGVQLSITNKDRDRLSLFTGIVGLVIFLVPILTLLIVFRISWKVSRVRKEVVALNQYWAEDTLDSEFR